MNTPPMDHKIIRPKPYSKFATVPQTIAAEYARIRAEQAKGAKKPASVVRFKAK